MNCKINGHLNSKKDSKKEMNNFRILDGWDNDPPYGKHDIDQWAEKSDKWSNGIDIKDGDEIQVKWPDGTTSTEKLSIEECQRSYEHDNGYGGLTQVPVRVKMAYFQYSFRGINHVIRLRHTKLTWKKL